MQFLSSTQYSSFSVRWAVWLHSSALASLLCTYFGRSTFDPRATFCVDAPWVWRAIAMTIFDHLLIIHPSIISYCLINYEFIHSCFLVLHLLMFDAWCLVFRASCLMLGAWCLNGSGLKALGGNGGDTGPGAWAQCSPPWPLSSWAMNHQTCINNKASSITRRAPRIKQET